jgi:23S rRNA pseudouridine2605 synthase
MNNLNSNSVRLQKFMAQCGIASRRKSEELIQEGLVKVNGVVVKELGTKVDTEEDIVEYRGNILNAKEKEALYLLLHKPRGVVSTVSDPEGRKTVMDFCKEIPDRIYPVGRLDYLSEGLMILTNDGELTHHLLHPKFQVEKVYEVKVFGHVNEELLKKLREGVYDEIGFLKPKSVRLLKFLRGKTWLEFRLAEGKNREIRRICEALGITIDKLKRVAIGGLSIQGIGPGQFVVMDKKTLLKFIGLNSDYKKVTSSASEYFSQKRSLTVNRRKKKRLNDDKLATQKKYLRYRKDTYYETIKKSKEIAETKK